MTGHKSWGRAETALQPAKNSWTNGRSRDRKKSGKLTADRALLALPSLTIGFTYSIGSRNLISSNVSMQKQVNRFGKKNLNRFIAEDFPATPDLDVYRWSTKTVFFYMVQVERCDASKPKPENRFGPKTYLTSIKPTKDILGRAAHPLLSTTPWSLSLAEKKAESSVSIWTEISNGKQRQIRPVILRRLN